MNDRGVSLGDAPRGAMEAPMPSEQKSKRRLSRRQILRSGAAALGGTGALLAGATSAPQNQGPAVLTGTQIGRTFRGLVRHDTTLDVQELRLLPIDPRQVVIQIGRASCREREKCSDVL